MSDTLHLGSLITTPQGRDATHIAVPEMSLCCPEPEETYECCPEPNLESGGDPAVTASHKWIEKWADEVGVGYEELMSHADDYVNHDEYWTQGGRFESWSLPDGFWGHYETVRGVKVPVEKQWSFFSCSC